VGWAHTRSKFDDLHGATGSPIAAEALRRISELYAVEGSIRGRTAEARRHVRNTSARPLIEMMKPWLEIELGHVPPAGPLAEAIRYALARWPALTRFLDDGRIELDNNPVQRAIRPIALGRKNHPIRGLGRRRRPMGNHLLPHRHRKAQQRRALCLAQRRPAAHDRRSSRQPPRRTLAVELATNKPQGLSHVQGIDAYGRKDER
jgi:Transposase IS66 family